MYTKHSISIIPIIIGSKSPGSYQIRVCLLHLYIKQTELIALDAKVTLVLSPPVCLHSEGSAHAKL